MSERTETVSVLIPVPSYVTDDDELVAGLVNRGGDACDEQLRSLGLRRLDENPVWAWKRLTREEALAGIAESQRAEQADAEWLDNAWLATVTVRVAEAE